MSWNMNKYVYGLTMLLLPALSFAAAGGQSTGIVNAFGRIVGQLIPIVLALAVLAFIWGLVKFVANAGNEQGREEGKQVMLWGIIALFVAVSIWGIVEFIRKDLDVPIRPEGVAPKVQNLPSN